MQKTRKLLLAVCVFVIAVPAMAQNFAVDNTGAGTFCVDHSASGGNFTTLTAAVTAANTAGGPHVINVCPGIASYAAPGAAFSSANYQGLTIRGTTGNAADVRVNASGGNEIFDLRQSAISIRDLTAISGNANDGIEIRANNILISNVEIQNTGRDGIFVVNSTGVVISNVVITGTGSEGIYANAGSTGLSINSADGSKPATAISSTNNECIEVDAAAVNIDDISLNNCGNEGIQIDGANATLDNILIDTTALEGILLNASAPLLNQDDPLSNTIVISNSGREGIRSTNNASNTISYNLTISNTVRECAEHLGSGDGVSVNFRNYNLSSCGLEGMWMRSADQVAEQIKVDGNAAGRECMEIDGANSVVSDIDLDNCSGIGLRVDGNAVSVSTVDINTSGNIGLRFDGTDVNISNADISNTNSYGVLVSGNDGVLNAVNISNVNNTGMRIENARADLDNIVIDNTRIHGVQISQHDADINGLTLSNVGTYLGGNAGSDGITVSNRRLNLNNIIINDAPDFGIHYNTTSNNFNGAVSFSNITITNTGDDGIFVNRSTNNLSMDDIAVSASADRGLTLFRSRRALLSNLNISSNSGAGIVIERSRDNEITDSNISNNGNNGISILTNNNNTTDEARDNLIHDNVFSGNSGFGLRIFNNGNADNDDNRIYENCFYTAAGINARDDENTGGLPSNAFDFGSRGNYWGSDSGGLGFSELCIDLLPADGICDTAYPIPLAANSTDNFPLTSCASMTFHHFNVTVSLAASTCTSTEVTIEAVDISGVRVPNYTGSVSLSTTSGNGNWDENDHSNNPSLANPAVNNVVDTPGDDDGIASYQFAGPADGGIVGLFLSNQHAETIMLGAEDTLVPGSSGSSGNVSFADNVFEISATTCTGSSCPGSGSHEIVAGRDHLFHVRLLRRDSGPSAECGVATTYNNAAQDLKVWIVRTANDPAGLAPTLAEQTALPGDGAIPVSDNVRLNFNTTPGEADFTLQTSDVGDYEIFLRDDSLAFAGVNIDGSSGAADPLSVRPFAIALSEFDDDGVLPASNPGGSAPADNGFVSAGSEFHARLGAYLYAASDDDGSGGGVANDGIADGSHDISDNGTTPAFAWDTVISVNKNTPLAVASVTGAFNNGSVNSGEYSGGEVQLSDLQYMEVGSITLDPSINDYLNLGMNFTVANGLARRSEVVGRFYADHFEFTVDTAPAFSASCGSFSYIDQAFDFATPPLLSARAYAKGISYPAAPLQNYHDFGGGENFWRLDLASDVGMSYSSSGEPAPTVSFDDSVADYSPASGSGSNGLVQFTLSGPFAYSDRFALPYGPVAPFSAVINLDFSVTDADSATGLQQFTPITFSSAEQRWGRLNIGNNYGSELLALTLPLQSEYFDGTGFALNTEDNCTTIAATDLILSSAVAAGSGPDIDITNLPACGGSGVATASIANAPFNAGVADLSFSIAAPANACTGYTDVSVDLSLATGLNMEWLLFDWNDDDMDGLANGPADDNPKGRASFGLYKGSRQFIYSREPWK